MKDSEEFCGELSRHSGREDASGLSVRGLLIAAVAGWAVRSALIVTVGIAGGCAHTSISRNDVECGNFSSSDLGVGIIHVPAGQYATYASACGAERFSRIVAQQRTAIVAGAHAAASGGRDAVARDHIARTQRDVLALQRDVDVIVSRVDGESDGGAR